jgi:hypothetical protein
LSYHVIKEALSKAMAGLIHSIDLLLNFIDDILLNFPLREADGLAADVSVAILKA